MVGYDGHVSKAQRITRPGILTSVFSSTNKIAPLKSQKVTMPVHPPPLSPKKYTHYEFIDESAAIMSPTLTQERSPTPSTRHFDAESSLGMLIEAVNASPSFTTQTMTPPSSPPALEFTTRETIRMSVVHATLICSEKQISRITGFHIELRRISERRDGNEFVAYSSGVLIASRCFGPFIILCRLSCIFCIPILCHRRHISTLSSNVSPTMESCCPAKQMNIRK